MPLERDPATGRLRVVPMRRVETEGASDDPFFDLDLDALEGAEGAVPATPLQTQEDFGPRDYAALAIRGLSALVPGGPLGALAGGAGEGIAQFIEGDFNPAQIAAQAGLGFVPFGRTAGVLRTAGKAAAHGALGGAGTTLAEQVDRGELDLGEIASGAKRGALIGGAAGGVGYAALRRFLGEGAEAAGDARLARVPGARGEFEMSGRPADIATREGGEAAAAGGDLRRVPYRPASPPIKHRGGVRGDLPEEMFTDVPVESPQDAMARLGLGEAVRRPQTHRLPPAPGGALEDELARTLESGLENPLADTRNPLAALLTPPSAVRATTPPNPAQSPLARLAGLDDVAAQRGRTAGEIDLTREVDALAQPDATTTATATPLSRLLRVSAPEFRDIQEARERLVDKTAGLPLPAGMRDQLDRMGLEYRRTRDAFNALRIDPNADPRELQRLQQATRELGSRLSGMEREAVRLAQTQVPTISGGGGGGGGGGGAPELPDVTPGVAPPGREGHFRLPETRVPDEQYNAVRRMLGIEESPAAVAERRLQDVGPPAGQVERRNPLPPEFRAVGDEAGFMSPELATSLGTGILGAGVGAFQAEEDDRLRDTILGGLLGFSVPTLARRDPETLRKLEQIRAGAMLSGGAQIKNVLGVAGSANYEALRALLRGDVDLGRRIASEFYSPESLRRVRDAFLDPTTDFERGTSPRGGPLAIFGRTMGATDTAARRALEIAGLTPEEARRAVLVADPTTQEGRRFLSYHNASPLARFFVPFARTNVNQIERAAETLRDIPQIAQGGEAGRDALARLLLAGGAAYGGYELGQEFPNATPFLTALAGPAGLPFLVGSTAGRLTDEGEANGDVLRGIFREVGRNLPLATDYSLDPGRVLASYVPNILRVLNPDTVRRDTSGSIFGPAIAKIPFLSETLPPR